jgi:hypothetical protein
LAKSGWQYTNWINSLRICFQGAAGRDLAIRRRSRAGVAVLGLGPSKPARSMVDCVSFARQNRKAEMPCKSNVGGTAS